jgi:ATP-dependent Clp protease protease subunit
MTFPTPPGTPTRPDTPPARPPDDPREDRGAWLYRQLLDRRIVLAQGTLDDRLATVLCAQLLTLDAEGDDPIQLHLNTPDGELGAALTVLDAVDVLRVPVRAVATGAVGGPALAVLVAAGERISYPHATFHLVEPRTQTEGTATEVAAHEANHRALANDFYARIAQVTGRDVEQVRADARKGTFFTAEQAVAYGLVEKVAPR